MRETIAVSRAVSYTHDMDDLAIELNIALLPAPELASRLVTVSGEFAALYPAVVRLRDGGRLALAPHLTLYQVAVGVNAVARLSEGLRGIALARRRATLRDKGIVYNAGEASLEAQTDVPDELTELQRAVIGLANPIREGRLLERDPAGNRVADLAGEADPLGRNIRDTGYAEVAELFRPHYTLNWFQLGTAVDPDHLRRAVDLSGEYSALGMFALGPYGTCPQLLARYEFGG